MLSNASAAADRRRYLRFPLFERARLRPNDWSTVQIGLRDISSGGFRAECDANLRIGGYVMLEVHGVGQVEAKVMWRRNDEIGAEFSRPISLLHCSWLSPDEPLMLTAGSKEDEATLMELLARRASRRAAELSTD